MNPKPDAMAVTTEAMSKSKLVFDCICSPPVTKLLKVRAFGPSCCIAGQSDRRS